MSNSINCFQFLGIPPKGEPIRGSPRASATVKFPISRDPPEGGTLGQLTPNSMYFLGFQFLGIPPKGEPGNKQHPGMNLGVCFQFLGIPPKGERCGAPAPRAIIKGFQFLGIPPKGEPSRCEYIRDIARICFQFLGIPPKGEQLQTPLSQYSKRILIVSNF